MTPHPRGIECLAQWRFANLRFRMRQDDGIEIGEPTIGTMTRLREEARRDLTIYFQGIENHPCPNQAEEVGS